MEYSEKLMDHFHHPRNMGTFEEDDNTIGTGKVGSAACGDIMQFQIKVIDNIIVDSRFKTFGCGSAIGSASYITELVKGKNLEDALKIKNKEVANELELPKIKVHCSVLAEEGIQAAIEDYQKKNNQ